MDHLTKDYGRFRALDDLTLSVNPGEVVGLLGPNGSGKTTALRLVLGFLRPTRGGAQVAGYDCWKESVDVRRRLTYLPGELRLYENMSGRQFLRFIGQLRRNLDEAKLSRLARRFDINLDRPIAHLSSGMKRKLALLQVLMPQVPLLILDEPTNTLDPTMRDELLEQLRQVRDQGQAVLFSSHVLNEVEKICDRVAILQQGRLVHLQSISDLQNGRLVQLRFKGVAPELPGFNGLQVLHNHQNQIAFEHIGDLGPLLQWLAAQNILDLRIEPLGLAGVYARYYGEKQ